MQDHKTNLKPITFPQSRGPAQVGRDGQITTQYHVGALAAERGNDEEAMTEPIALS